MDSIAADPVGGRSDAALALTLVVLAGSNVMTNVVLPSQWYVPWNLSVALVLIAIARSVGGRSAAALGLRRSSLVDGLRWGGAIGGAIACVLVAASIVPATSGWFADDVGRIGGGELALRLLVTIPLGTVLMEEVAFRGCLPALLDARSGAAPWRTVALSSALFGLWHVLPSRQLGERNETMGSVVGDGIGRWAPVAVAVVATTIAGAGLWWLRRRADSVAAPMLVHYSLNAAATAAAWIAAR